MHKKLVIVVGIGSSIKHRKSCRRSFHDTGYGTACATDILPCTDTENVSVPRSPGIVLTKWAFVVF